MKKAMLLLVAAGATAFAFAQEPASGQGGRSSGANYVCGGVGIDQQEAMKAQAPGHSLMLTFAASTGAYLANVQVQITDSRGNVLLGATCPGPIMLVDLPHKDTWHVRAQAGGVTREKTVTAGGGGTARAALLWPAASVS
jgi:hypothetical protein